MFWQAVDQLPGRLLHRRLRLSLLHLLLLLQDQVSDDGGLFVGGGVLLQDQVSDDGEGAL